MSNLTNFIRQNAGSIGLQYGEDTSSFGALVSTLQRWFGHTDADGVSSEWIGSLACCSTLLGRYPTNNNTQVLHLDEPTCRALFEEMYFVPDPTTDVTVWDTHPVHDGDMVAKAYIGPFETTRGGAKSRAWTSGHTVGDIQDFPLGNRTMILIPTLTEGVEVMMLQFGPLVLTAPAGYSHYGLSVPSEYLSQVCIRSFGMHAPCCFIRTGDVGTTVCAANSGNPTFNFSRPLLGEATTMFMPDFVMQCRAWWSPGAASTLYIPDMNYLSIAHLTYRSMINRTLRLVISDIGANVTSVFAVCTDQHKVHDAVKSFQKDRIIDYVTQRASRMNTFGRGVRGAERCCDFRTLLVKRVMLDAVGSAAVDGLVWTVEGRRVIHIV